MRISLAQYAIAFGDPGQNLERIRRYAETAAREQSQLLILPELCLHGYHKSSILAGGQFHLPQLKDTLAGIAVQYKVGIIGTYVESVADARYNTMAYIHNDGTLLAAYRKKHLFQPMKEHLFFSPGSELCVASTSPAKLGFAVCYDLRFPEQFRKMTAQGAEMFIIPAEWPQVRLDHWLTLLKARAIENLAWVVGCNCTGMIYKTLFGGNSVVISPWGDVIFQATEKEGVYTLDVNMETVRSIRREKPFLKDMEAD